jgi:hypothetical protein
MFVITSCIIIVATLPTYVEVGFHGCSFHPSLPTIGNSKSYQATTIMLLQLIFPSNGAQYLNGSYFQIITFAFIKNT